ncbi:hypothetical protein AAHA92_20811 [Salvia divinorum]
MNKQ